MHRKSSRNSEEEFLLQSNEYTKSLLDDSDADSINLDAKQSLFGAKNPYEESGILSKWFFSWVTPLVGHGYRNKLKLENLGVLPSSYHTSIQEERVNEYWQKYQHKKGYPLIWAICMAYKGEFMLAFFLSFLSSIPEICTPFVIQRFLIFIEDDDESVWVGIAFGFLYVFLTFVSRIIMEQATFYQMQLGSKCSAGVVGLIYTKALKVSSATNKSFTQGEIVNFIQVDAKKVIIFAWRLPGLAKLPIILIYCIIMCFIYFGYTFYSGIIFISLSIALNYGLAILTARRQVKVLKSKDDRMRTISETINSIKIIKLNSWIEGFIAKIKGLRDTEIWMLKTRFFVTCVNLLAIFLLPGLLILIVFGVAIGSGIKMRVSTAFAALQVLNMLRDPTRWLPFFIGMMMEFTVSMNRIQRFLKAEEINNLLIEYNKDPNSEAAISIKDSNFSWGGEKIDTEEETKKKELLNAVKEEGKTSQKNGHAATNGNAVGHSSPPKKYIINEDMEESETIISEDIETNGSVSQNGKDKKDVKIKDIITLKGLNLTIQKGEFVCIIGEIGSGKSSLINTLMADLIYTSDETIAAIGEHAVDDSSIQELFDRSKSRGIIQISGSVSYVQQVPWIQNKTLRDNILFGEPLDEDKYNATIDKCQLVSDFDQLDGGDLTEIGEKGINLSGGQKARVSLARAVYAQKDVILMDDPISALDANTKKKIFDQVFLDELKGKTRILVTHAVDFLDKVDRIIIMDHCKIKYMGTYDELKDNEVIQHIIETLKEVSDKEQEEEEKEIHDIEMKKKTSSEGATNHNNGDLDKEDQNVRNTMKNVRKMSYMSNKSSNITSDEYEEKVDAGWSIYWKFLISDWTWTSLSLSLPIYAAYGYAGIQSTRYIGIWINNMDQPGSFEKYFSIILVYTMLFGIFVTLGFFLIMMSVLRASNILHRKMTENTLRSPINLYFDKTPTGKILNRFSKDINKLDADFPFTLTFVVECLSWIVATVFVSALVSPWSLLCIPFVFIAGIILTKYYIKAYREMTRIETVTNSPILSNFSETLTGNTTIRCFRRESDFIKKNHVLVDDNLIAYFWLQSLNIWFSIRLQFISSFMMMVSLAFCILYKYSADVSTIGTLLIYLLTLQANILWFFRIASEVEGGMVSYDRCDQILHIPQEEFGMHSKPRASWPEEGKIEFKNL